MSHDMSRRVLIPRVWIDPHIPSRLYAWHMQEILAKPHQFFYGIVTAPLLSCAVVSVAIHYVFL